MTVRRLITAAALTLAAGCTPVQPSGGQTGVPVAAVPQPAVSVGSPVDGRWGRAGEPGSTPAGDHHRLGKATPMNQWAVDLRVPAGTPVVFGVAADHGTVTAEITQIVDGDACRAGGGGDFVTVGLYHEGVLLGRVTYAHLRRDRKLRVGSPVAPKAVLGTVAALDGENTGGPACWTGPHVHLELRSETGGACWRDRAPGTRVRRGEVVGFVSGPLGRSPTVCAR
ncbi:hypothetical protein Cs7R123_14680 [Catellatospora sp. TT07R-123]|uniref:M23 family metallopeptidase n=1 Tax=Catellatospora sp. TT07R-123 TaxID=2733863 RepID=UPI001B0C7B9F|nr:M23 family metallopeptidase [Catellatospora sp. TT07R-123]GHJ44126.1 hypothetical protein Cs7R123_14680 [Catellatospora sp. TT07R-123]